MSSEYRVIVVGCGGPGSAALYWAARAAGGRSGAVLGLEAGRAGTRPDRTLVLSPTQPLDVHAALAPGALETWRDVERVSGQTLVAPTGELVVAEAGRGGEAVLDGYRAVAARHGTPVEELDARALHARWPQIRVTGGERALHQRGAGVVDAGRAAAVHRALARGRGAEVREDTPVRAVRPRRDHVEVVTDDAVHRADQVVVTADAVAAGLLADVGRPLPLVTRHEQVTRYATANLLDHSPGPFPVVRWHGAEDLVGFPVHGAVATTLDQELDGEPSFEADALLRKRREEFLEEHLPGFGGPELSSTTCATTIAPDRHLVVDTVPEAPAVHVAVGTGHGGAYASLLGRVLAEFATAGRSRFPVDTFSLDRPALLDADFERRFGF
ncbi:FAD-dependent oxidoreductase [Actinomycetospora chiangmaiensis]|uniref:FAD-dependent oxidoreductase n=1 Tax=Actinomycetospora chiangmaiensis TaxID=402650 RepID=UPI0003606F01|nr:FAD-dependent oxidoreductase [Actinomycetospora chiangmaiensis]